MGGILAGARGAATAASEKVNEHRDTRSFLLAAAERPTAVREDIKVSLELSFGIVPDGKRKSRQDAGGTKQKRPDWVGAQYATGILYHEGNAGRTKNLGQEKEKSKAPHAKPAYRAPAKKEKSKNRNPPTAGKPKNRRVKGTQIRLGALGLSLRTRQI